MKISILFLPSFMLLLLLSSCGGNRVYVNEEADFGFYSRVGLMTFSNLSSDNNAGEKVTSSFRTELLFLKEIEVANAGDFAKAVRAVVKEMPLNLPESFSSEDAIAIGQEAKVEGIFVGAVKDYGMVRSGQTEFPLVSIIVRFIDCQTGKVVWSFEQTQKGGPKFPVFSFGETHTLGEMTAKVCREAVKAFARSRK